MQFLRVVVVIALVVWAAVLATPKGRTPLALRGIQKLLRRTNEIPENQVQPVGVKRRLIAFLMVLAALAIALFR